MVVIDSDKNTLYGVIKALAVGLIVPLLLWWAAGALADRHPDMFGLLSKLNYWDWVLINILSAVFRGGSPQKWWVKEEK